MTTPAPETKPEETTPEVLETKVEETAEKLEEAKGSDYATKEEVGTLTAMLAEFRKELADSKKPKVPAPEKKEEKPVEKKSEEKPKEEAPKPTEPKADSYGSRRWFGGR